MQEHWALIASAYDTLAESEEARLRTGRDRLEFEFATRTIGGYLEDVKRVIDLGSGPGTYALWLAKQDISVHLVDLSARSLRLAELLGTRSGVGHLLSARHGDAANLEGEPSESFDVALVLGPVYHAPDRAYVVGLMEEVRRVLTARGILITNVVNPFYMLSRLCSTEEPRRLGQLLDEITHVGNAFYKGPTDDVAFWMCSEGHMRALLADQQFEILESLGSKAILQGRERETRVEPNTEVGPWIDLMIKSARTAEFRASSEYIWFVARKETDGGRFVK